MKKKTETTWTIDYSGVETHVYEVIGDEGKTYDEAKQEAISHLESLVKPYLDRLEELRADAFLERGRLPELRVWKGNRKLVAARTKKHATELLKCSRYEFQTRYDAVNEDDWWYQFARQEGVWARRKDQFGLSTGEYVKVLSRREAESLLTDAVEPYVTMTFGELERLVGKEVSMQGCSRGGAPYSMRVTIRWCQGWYERGCIEVESRILDEFDAVWPRWHSVTRRPFENSGTVAPEINEEVACA